MGSVRITVGDRRRSIATDFLTVYRTDADPRCVDLSLDPSRRTVGSLWGVRPDWINYGAVGFGRIVSPEAWLSTWSGLSSRASIERTGPGMTLPALLVSYAGDHGIFPSDNDLIASAIRPTTFERVHRPGRPLRLPRGRRPARGHRRGRRLDRRDGLTPGPVASTSVWVDR